MRELFPPVRITAVASALVGFSRTTVE